MPVMSRGGNEAFSRVLIVNALEFSGWYLLDPMEVRFEVSMDGKRADYLRVFLPDLTRHGYQILSMDVFARPFDDQRLRKCRLEMATGTGKTLLCAALIRRFLVTRNAERVLFIVDRIELARQTLEDFAVILARAFAGQFVAQDPAEESAGKLLETIRSGRPPATGGKSPRKEL